jgi:hypothetical protein
MSLTFGLNSPRELLDKVHREFAILESAAIMRDETQRDYVTRSVQAWRFPPRETSCRRQTTITFAMADTD